MFPQMTDDTKVWWSDMIKTVGFPIAMCCALMWGGYNIFTVFITPTFNKQMQTLESVTETQGKMVDRLDSVTDRLSSITTDVQSVKAAQTVHQLILTELTSSQKEALDTLKKIEENTDHQ